MQPVPSTAEMLAFKMLGRNADKRWADWAYDMLMAGYDTENLVILAGELEPFNQFEIEKLTDKIFAELGLTWDNRELVYKNYACYLVGQALSGKKAFINVLDILNGIYLEREFEPPYKDFYSLYYAIDDLKYSNDQYYLAGVSRENIDEVIVQYFTEWHGKCNFQF